MYVGSAAYRLYVNLTKIGQNICWSLFTVDKVLAKTFNWTSDKNVSCKQLIDRTLQV